LLGLYTEIASPPIRRRLIQLVEEIAKVTRKSSRAAAEDKLSDRWAKSRERIWPSKHLSLVHPIMAETIDAPARSCLDTLDRLRGGWRPGRHILSSERRADHWSVTHSAEAMAYQFVASARELSAGTSVMIATVLALDPGEGRAFLFSGRWVTLGEPLPEMPSLRSGGRGAARLRLASPSGALGAALGWSKAALRVPL